MLNPPVRPHRLRNRRRVPKEVRRDRRSVLAALELLEPRVMLTRNAIETAQIAGFAAGVGRSEAVSVQIDPLDGNVKAGRALVGLITHQAPGSTLDPSALQVVSTRLGSVKPILQRKDVAGRTASLTLVEASSGIFSVLVGAERGTAGEYRVATFLVGDVDGDLRVSKGDLAQVRSALGAQVGSTRYLESADADRDGRITHRDLQLARRNLGAAVEATLAASGSFTVPGQAGETVATDIALTRRMTRYRNEVGLFLVDDATGRVGGLTPGDLGYAAAALSADRRFVLFTPGQEAGAVAHLNLPAASHFGTYIVADGTLDAWMARGTNRSPGRGPQLHFSFPSANSDRYPHVVRLPGEALTLGLEDFWKGGDRDHDDAVLRITFPDVTPPALPDVTPPALTLGLDPASDTAPVGDDITTTAIVNLVGRTEPNLTVTLLPSGATTTADSQGRFVFTGVALTVGANAFTAQARDADGNLGRVERTIIFGDTEAPIVSITSPGSGTTTESNALIVGTATDALSGLAKVEARIDDGPFLAIAFDAAGNFQLPTTFALDGSADGTHVVEIRATDRAGNISPPVTTSFVLSTTLPPLTLELAPESDTAPVGDGMTALAAVTLVGRTLPGITVTFPGLSRSVVADATGLFTLINVPLALGMNTITAEVTRSGGRVGRAQVTVERCGFLDDLAGWRGKQTGGTDPGRGAVTVESGTAVLREGNSFEVTLSGSFIVPANPTTIAFEYTGPSFDTSDPSFINDAFEVALLGENGVSLVPTFTTGRDAFFNITEGLNAATGSGVTIVGQMVTLNIAQAIPGTTATLVFRLVNNDDDTQTSVNIVCVDSPATTAPSLSSFTTPGPENRALILPNLSSLVQTTQVSATNSPAAGASGGVALGQIGPPVQSTQGDSLLDGDGRVTFTTSTDFLRGTSFNVNATEVADELRLDPPGEARTFPFIWVSNSDEGTVSRFDTVTGKEIGRYRTGPSGAAHSPSRTAVASDGSVWVANRAFNIQASMVHVTLKDFIDRNGNGVVDTSMDLNGNGKIDANEILPWDANNDDLPDDERIALSVAVGRDRTSLLPQSNGIARSIAIDANDDVWVGLFNFRQYEVYDHTTGALKAIVPVAGTPYGAVIDASGILYGANRSDFLDRIDTNTRTSSTVALTGDNYGITLDSKGVVWATTNSSRQLLRYEPASGQMDSYGLPGTGRGVGAAADGTIWVATNGPDLLVRYNFASDGRTQLGAAIPVPVGSVASAAVIDADGFIWTTTYGDNKAWKIDPATNTVVPGWPISTGLTPYNYSDMTGQVRLTVTERTGTWTEIVDGERSGVPWSTVGLETDLPQQTLVRLRVRASDSRTLLPSLAWVEVAPDSRFAGIQGRYLEVESALRSRDPNATPSLSTIDVVSLPLPTITAETASQVAAGTVIVLSGIAEAAQPLMPSGARTRNTVTHVMVNGKPVDVLDAAGRFFTRVTVSPGENHLEVTASDLYGQTTTKSLVIEGVQRDASQVDFSLLSDITASFAVDYARTSFRKDEAVLYSDVAVKNVGQYPVDAPLYVAIANLSDPRVTPLEPAGFTPEGRPYYDVSSRVPGGRLGPNGLTNSFPFAFANPAQVQFDYDLVFFGLLNRAPIIATVPDVEALSGRTYTYDVDATDPDGDPVRFLLTTGPAGMTIDPTTGFISWSPTDANLGTHPIVVRVEDGRGGFTEQSFDVSTIVPPPNRPPVFTTLPVVEAHVGDTYTYRAAATDPDADALTFEFVASDPVPVAIVNPGFEAQYLNEGGYVQSTLTGWTIHQGDQNAGPFNPGSAQYPGGNVLEGRNVAYSDFATLSQILAARLEASTHYALSVAVGQRLDVPLAGYAVELWAGGRRLASASAPIPAAGSFATVSVEYVSPSESSLVGQHLEIRLGSSGNQANFDDVRLTARPPDHPGGMTLDSAAGLIHWTPASLQVGDAGVTLAVRDGRGGVATQHFTICVTEAPGNHAPVIVSQPAIVHHVGVLSGTTTGSFGSPIILPNGVYGISSVNGGTNNRIFSGDSGNYVQFDGSQIAIASGGLINLGAMTYSNGTTYEPTIGGDFPLTVRLAIAGAATSDFDFTFNILSTPNNGSELDSADRLRIANPGEISRTFDYNGRLYTVELVGFSNDGGQTIVREFISLENQTAFASLYARVISVAEPDEGSDVSGAYVYQVGGLDADSDDLIYSLADGPNGMTIDLRTGKLVWLPGLDQIGRHDIVISVSDGRGGSDVQSFPLEVTTTTPPVVPPSPTGELGFRSTPSTAIQAGILYRYDAEVIHPVGATLAFDLPVAPDGMTVHPTLGVLVWTPTADQVGTHQVMLRVQDANGGIALQSFEIVVSAANTAPVVTSTPPGPATVGNPYEYRILAQDAEGAPLTFVLLTPMSAGLSVDGAGVLRFTPTAGQVGSFAVAVKIADSKRGLLEYAFTIPVVASAANVDPVIRSTPPLIARQGARYAYQVIAQDADGDPLTYELLKAPAGMTVGQGVARDGSPLAVLGLIVWTPSAADVGKSHEVEVRVSDGRGSGTIQRFTIEALAQGTNGAPRITSNPFTVATVGRDFVLDLKAVDPDGDPLLWSLISAPQGMSLDSVRGTLRWRPMGDQMGPSEVVVEVSDPSLATASQRFTIVVNCDNQGPSITSAPPTQAWAGDLYVYAVRADDPENDPLLFELLAKPDGMTIDEATGLIRWAPSAAQGGPASVAVQVSDGQGGIVTQTFTVVVSSTPRNRAPVITSTPHVNATLGVPYVYQLTGVDPEGELLHFEPLSVPSGMTVNETTGLVSWAPGEADAGPHVVVLAAIDPSGAKAVQTFVLNARGNAPPAILSTPTTAASSGTSYRYDVRASDPNGDPLTYTLTAAPSGMTVDTLGRIAWQVPANDPTSQPVPVSLVVRDPQGAVAVQTFAITVSPDSEAPTVTLAVSNSLANPGDTVRFQVWATDNVGVVSVSLTMGGQPLILDATGRASLIASQPGVYNVIATAIDAAGNVGTSSPFSLRIFDTSDTAWPVVTITSPSPDRTNNEVTYLTDVMGSVSDDNLEFWTLAYARVDQVDLDRVADADPDWKQFAHGTQNVPTGKLGTFDPTMLINGPYVIRLLAQDFNGQIQTKGVIVNVTGSAKIGNFHLEFTDLQVPLAGIPITITRVYDTMTANDEGDFGYGWTLGVQDARILETVALGDDFVPGQTKVYLTAPDGSRIGFTYQEQFVSGFPGLGVVSNPYFTADKGVTETLAVEGQVGRGWALGGLSDPINFDTYVLTTIDGTKYRYSQHDGLQRIDDPNGNSLQFTDQGIFSSSGVSITYERDYRGRITTIVQHDWQGKAVGDPIRYAYDAAGDLKAFTAQGNLVTRFNYLNGDNAHFLDEAYDPNGNRSLKVVYENNRFVKIIDALGNTVDQRNYDLEARTAVIRDGNGNAKTLVYDVRGNVLTETDALGHVTRYEYGDLSQPDLETKIIDAMGNVTERTYDTQGNVKTIRETGSLTNPLPKPILTSFTYDTHGNVTRITNDANQTTSFSYDTRGHLSSIANAIGDTSGFTYDDLGRRATFTDFNGNMTTFSHIAGCGCGSPSLITFADGTYQTFKYNDFGQVTKEATFEANDTLVEIVTTAYDTLGRETEVIRGTGADSIVTRKFYKGTNLDYEMVVNPASPIETRNTPVSQRMSRITAYDYDVDGRMIRQINPDGGIVDFRYDPQGNRVLLMDPVGNVTTWVYDKLNHVAEERDPFYWQTFTSGKLVSQIDLTAILAANKLPSGANIDANRGAEHVTVSGYDAMGNRIEIIDRDGRRREFDFDHTGRTTAERWYAAETDQLVRTMTWTYDKLGNLKEAADPDSHYVYTYDTLNRVKTVDNAGTPGAPRVVLGYGYDKQGNVISTSDNLGTTVASAYDQRNRLDVRTWSGGGVDPVRIEFDYNAAGRQTLLKRFASLDQSTPVGRTVTTYETTGQVDTLIHRNAVDAVLAGYDYDYDFGGLVVGENRGHQDPQFGQRIVYDYDLNGQLIDADYETQPDEQFVYDLNGNRRLARTRADTTTYDPPGPANQLRGDGRFQYEYDGEGNLFRKTDVATRAVTTYGYDHRNRLASVEERNGDGALRSVMRFVYGVDGRRIAKVVGGSALHTVYNGDNAWADIDETGVDARYLFGNTVDELLARQREGDEVVFYLTDRLGTVRDLADTLGNLVNRVEYSSFGSVVVQTNPVAGDRYLFTGREYDSETGLYYYRARFLDPSGGRFVSKDPLGFDSGDVNLYGFIKNSPLIGIDPSGSVIILEETQSNFQVTIQTTPALTASEETQLILRLVEFAKTPAGDQLVKLLAQALRSRAPQSLIDRIVVLLVQAALGII